MSFPPLGAVATGNRSHWQTPEPPGLSSFARRVQDRGCRVASRLSRALTSRQQQAQRQQEHEQHQRSGASMVGAAGDCSCISAANATTNEALHVDPTVGGRSSPQPVALPTSIGVAVVTATSPHDTSALVGGMLSTAHSTIAVPVGEETRAAAQDAAVSVAPGGPSASQDAVGGVGAQGSGAGGDVNDDTQAGGRIADAAVAMGGVGDWEEEDEESLAEHYDPAM